jgi:hypothetical protein
MLSRFRVGLLLVASGAAWGCDLTPSDDILDGKACDSRGACSEGYTCDRRYNVCRSASAPQCDAGACNTAAPLPESGSSPPDSAQ